jgi:hypothetical protein
MPVPTSHAYMSHAKLKDRLYIPSDGRDNIKIKSPKLRFLLG